ncbi:MAG TPA: Hpt domain-containing protein, partial [Novosphingobium sp.]|nr:Hpt domain-containing protein [Novosphingobium sp.]
MTPEEIQQIFFVECEESLAAAEAGLAACREGTQDDDTVNGVFRAVHSIKGGAGAFGFAALQAYTHCFETLLSDVREGLVPLGEPLVDLLLRALDTLSDHVAAARDGSAPPADDALLAELTSAQAGNGTAASQADADREEASASNAPVADDEEMGLGLDAMLDDLLGGGGASEVPAAAEPWTLRIRPKGAAMDNGSEPLAILRELAAMGAVCIDCDTSRVPSPDGFDAACGYLEWTLSIPGEVSHDSVRDLFDFNASEYELGFDGQPLPPPVEDVPPKAPARPAASDGDAPLAPARPEAPRENPVAAAPASQSIRIDLVKLDRLIDSVGELVIAQAMLAQRLTSENLAAAEELTLLETLTRDIQESAMSIRAQPIGSVFSRVPRILRELAASTGKHVRLEVIGETTELDKTVIERLGEPLTHLIRNAVDHGIENA